MKYFKRKFNASETLPITINLQKMKEYHGLTDRKCKSKYSFYEKDMTPGLLISILVLLFNFGATPTTYGFQARQQVSRHITDATTNVTLPGVDILVKVPTRGGVSELESAYSLDVPNPETVLMFS